MKKMDVFLNLAAPDALDLERTDWKTLRDLLAACPGGLDSTLASKVTELLDAAPAVLRTVLSTDADGKPVCVSIVLRINTVECSSPCEGCITNFTLIQESRGSDLVRMWNATALLDRWDKFWVPLLKQHAPDFWQIHCQSEELVGCSGRLELVGGAQEDHLPVSLSAKKVPVCVVSDDDAWSVAVRGCKINVRSVTYR